MPILKKSGLGDYQFSEISNTGKVPTDASKKKVLAYCLNDWGAIMAGGTMPENFGKGMVEAGKVLGFPPTPDRLEEEADKILK